MVKQSESLSEDGVVQSENTAGEIKECKKKTFIEPAISVPVDVLEATTFFVTSTSGATN